MKVFRSFIIAFVLSFAFFGVIYGLGLVSLQSKTADAKDAVTFKHSDSRIEIGWFGDEYYIDYSFLPEFETIQPRLITASYMAAPPIAKFLNSSMVLGSVIYQKIEPQLPDITPFLEKFQIKSE